ncbi:DEKNAAC100660 [Brettanomyces naardenensis]|uniref:DEKNAAC100660 n=1 Tax=Brettanomyces naardenensis TaxID=13370 RepID=A0A448YEF6_BRENA|nr:DEKNAAC100660 [Brettanomyces naardenensis]
MAAPRGRIMHRGLFHSYEGPSSESSSLQVKLPNNLVYENVVHSIGEDIKYRKMLSINDSLQLKTEGKATLREVLLHKYGLMKQELTDKDISTLYDFLIHYEKVRFSGIPIAYDEFVIFMGLWSRVKNDIWKYKKV